MKAQSSYSQSVDSLPLKELNNEFLKGIQARERVVSLKQIIKQDSLIICNYRDSIIPNLQLALDTTEVLLAESYLEKEKLNWEVSYYKTGFWSSLGLVVLLLIFN